MALVTQRSCKDFLRFLTGSILRFLLHNKLAGQLKLYSVLGHEGIDQATEENPMKIAVKSIVAGAAIAVAATLGAPMAQAVVDTNDAAHSGTHASTSTQRDAQKHEPTTKTSRSWGPAQFG